MSAPAETTNSTTASTSTLTSVSSSSASTTVATTTSATRSTSSTTSPTSSTTSSSLSSSSSPLPPTVASSSPSPTTTVAPLSPTLSTSFIPSQSTSTIIKTPPGGGLPSTIVQTITTSNPVPIATSDVGVSFLSSSSASSPVGSAGAQNAASSTPQASVVAPAVIVPVIGVAIAIILGIFLWRRRKQRKEAAEMRQKEMEEYSYNPNNDPTIPVVGALSTNDGEDNHTEGGGYRGWGTTSTAVAASRKQSTTVGANSTLIGIARSDSSGHGYDGNNSPKGHSPERDPRTSGSPEGLGALGVAPLASKNKSQSVNREVSNASSAYSGAQRSDASENGPVGLAGSPQYYDDFMLPETGPHAEGYGQPVIRDVSARRNTRIENPAVFPQHGNAGIAQNF